jgi:protein-export membrane protein SecD/preprotein translocase SecF subunit
LKHVFTFLALLVLSAAALWYSLNPAYPAALGLDLKGGMRVTLEPDRAEMREKGIASVSEEDMKAVRDILETRVNSFGLSGTEVRLKRGVEGDQVVVVLPGAKNPQEALQTLSTTAQMEFRHFDEVAYEGGTGTRRYSMHVIPGDPEKGVQDRYTFRDSSGKEVPAEQVIKESPKILDGKFLLPRSRAEIDPSTSRPVVTFELNGDGARTFAEFTSNNVNEILAIVLDNEVISAPRIDTPITEGRGIITGSQTMPEARTLANLLNSGALPIPLKPVETQSVGATLGQASIQQSINAGLVGLGIVLLFMLAYYWLPGFVACLALIVYAALSFWIFKGVPLWVSGGEVKGLFTPGVVLDLPGITGFILSIGMAVDGNVLIFERMKEELRAGKTLDTAIDSGFTRAFTAIIDSNITVWIISAILIWLGAPVVKGFAITLAIGNAVAMFTAITVTRSFLHVITLMEWARNPNLYALNNSWLGLVFPQWKDGAVLRIYEKRKLYLGVSLALVIVSLVFIALSPFGMGLKPGIDFTGGGVIEAAFRDPKITQDQVETVLAQNGITDATVRLNRSEVPWTKVTIEATDVDQPTQKLIQERLAGLRGFDPQSYKVESASARLQVPSLWGRPYPQLAQATPAPAANTPAPAGNAPAANAPTVPAANTPAPVGAAANAPAGNAPAGTTTPAEGGKRFQATASFTSPVTEAEIRQALNTAPTAGAIGNLQLKNLRVSTEVVRHQGDERIPVAEVFTRQNPDKLQAALLAMDKIGGSEAGAIIQPMSRVTSVGPSVAKELVLNAIFSALVGSLAMLLFLAARFAIGGFINGLKFGAGAVIALMHDVIGTIGFFAIMGVVAGWQVDSLFVTACLGLLGFSVNDTIVIYDRIRENLHPNRRRKGETFAEVSDRSMTESFDRSFNTSFAIMLALAAMVIFGGETLRLFNVALLFGMAIGTYSSVFVASPLVVMMEEGAHGAGPARPQQPVRREEPAKARREPVAAASRPAPAPRPAATEDGEDAGDTTETESRPRSGVVRPKKKRRL